MFSKVEIHESHSPLWGDPDHSLQFWVSQDGLLGEPGEFANALGMGLIGGRALVLRTCEIPAKKRKCGSSEEATQEYLEAQITQADIHRPEFTGPGPLPRLLRMQGCGETESRGATLPSGPSPSEPMPRAHPTSSEQWLHHWVVFPLCFISE